MKTLRRLAAGAVVVMFSLFGSLPDSAWADPAGPGANQPVLSGKPVNVIVMLQRQPQQASLGAERANLGNQKDLIDGWSRTLGLTVREQFGYLLNGFAATLPSSAIPRLLADPAVRSVQRERIYHLLENDARVLEGVPAAEQAYRTDGRGMVVSVIDTGVDATHKDMRLDFDCESADSPAKIKTFDKAHPEGHFSCKVPFGYNYAENNYAIKDTNPESHGMHVAGIVAANAQDVARGVRGVAPNAQILAMKVTASGGGATDSAILQAMEDSVKLRADVINLSFGGDNGVANVSDGISRVIDTATRSGVGVVLAAGNSGKSYAADDLTQRLDLYDDGALASPASQLNAFAVASVENIRADAAASKREVTPSYFTSWGTTSALDFKPNIAGVGGGVYSTYNDNAYGYSGGTSMASPNVAGLVALTLQAFAGRYPEMTPAQRLALAKTALSNTTVIPSVKGIPASPRQVGAGLARVDRALATEVTATVGSMPTVALREVKGPRSIEVLLTNHSDSPRRYRVPTQQVIREIQSVNNRPTTQVSTETLSASTQEVTVAAKSTAKVTFTLTPHTASKGFVGGWARLEALDNGEPDLQVPYFGFVGDWNAEPIIATPGATWEGIPGGKTTALLTYNYGQEIEVAPNAHRWISPNGDGRFDTLVPRLKVLRNARYLTCEIRTPEGTLVRRVGHDEDLHRGNIKDLLRPEPADTFAQEFPPCYWDGLSYNPKTGMRDPLPDGDYVFRLSARLSDGFDPQTLDLPFSVDTTAPRPYDVSVTDATLTFKVREAGAGLESVQITTAGGAAKAVTPDATGVYRVPITNTDGVTILTKDAVGNTGSLPVVTRASTIRLDTHELHGFLIGADDSHIVGDTLVVTGMASPDVTRVVANGKEVSVTDGMFEVVVDLPQGDQGWIEVSARGTTTAGTTTNDAHLRVYYDGIAPVLTVDGLSDGGLDADEQGRIHLVGSLTDTRTEDPRVELTYYSAEGKALTIPVGKDGRFDTWVTVPASREGLILLGYDGANLVKQRVAIRHSGAPQPPVGDSVKPTWSNMTCDASGCVLNAAPGDVTESTFVLRGTAKPGTTVRLTPQPAALGDPVEGTGSLALTLPLGPGTNRYLLEVIDIETNNVVASELLKLVFDAQAPTLAFDTPSLVAGTLFTKTPAVRFAGHAQDDGTGYRFSLNGNEIIGVSYLGTGAEANRRTFDETLTLATGDVVEVRIRDDARRERIAYIPVIVDTDGPTLDLGVTDKETVSSDKDVTVSARDTNLASLTVTLDKQDPVTKLTSLATNFDTIAAHLVGPDEVTTHRPAPASPDTTTLSYAFSAATLPAGVHTLNVRTVDLAGNETTKTHTFTITREAARTLKLEVDREKLDDQAALIEAAKALIDDVRTFEAPASGLQEGGNIVTVIHDTNGHYEVVNLMITVKSRMLSADGVEATGSFRSDDALTVNRSVDEAGATVLSVGHGEGFGPVAATVTFPVEEGTTVCRVISEGCTPVEVTDGEVRVETEVPVTFRLTPAPAPTPEPEPNPAPQPQPPAPEPDPQPTPQPQPPAPEPDPQPAPTPEPDPELKSTDTVQPQPTPAPQSAATTDQASHLARTGVATASWVMAALALVVLGRLVSSRGCSREH